jgi:hypothetical protein
VVDLSPFQPPSKDSPQIPLEDFIFSVLSFCFRPGWHTRVDSHILSSDIGTMSKNNLNCDLAGKHFNPSGMDHGSRDSAIRHAGDLGNVDTDGQGDAFFRFPVSGLSLSPGNTYILG